MLNSIAKELWRHEFERLLSIQFAFIMIHIGLFKWCFMADSTRQKLNDLLSHIEGAYAPNTLRAYRADMLEFITYCDTNDLPGLPATPETVAKFLMQTIHQGIKSSTIRRKVSSISAIHRLSYMEDPTKHPEVKITQRKIFRQLGTRFDQAYPITRKLLDKLLAECESDLHGLRNRALLLIAYESMRRRSELVALRVEDIEWLDGLVAAERRLMTATGGTRSRSLRRKERLT